jgi:hypothetical protein
MCIPSTIIAEGDIELSEEGAVAALITEEDGAYSLITTGVELTKGKHYWEVELLSEHGGEIWLDRATI